MTHGRFAELLNQAPDPSPPPPSPLLHDPAHTPQTPDPKPPRYPRDPSVHPRDPRLSEGGGGEDADEGGAKDVDERCSTLNNVI